VIVVQDDFVVDHAETVPSRSEHPHGLRTINTIVNGWDCLKVEGDIFAIDIPSLSAAANHAFLKRPVRLVVDLTAVVVCREEGIGWLREVSHRVGRRGGELVVAVATDGPLQQLLEYEGVATSDGNQVTRLLSDDPTARCG
jgi:anti-anti-sigma regulatory factor